MKAEFKTGDIVHFQPYSERTPIKAKVLNVLGRDEGFFIDRVEYKLEGISAPLISNTTGRSIMESEEFDLISEKDAFKD
jgi:hypothetical protein|tara:strand:- start:604 stop:840 length:237 start_codon:yes stop_codon:yes gene_type:complete